MSTTELIEMIEKLPADKQKEVEDFIRYKFGAENELTHMVSAPKGSDGRGYGSLKGLITFISDDFDEPLEDFKDYM